MQRQNCPLQSNLVLLNTARNLIILLLVLSWPPTRSQPATHIPRPIWPVLYPQWASSTHVGPCFIDMWAHADRNLPSTSTSASGTRAHERRVSGMWASAAVVTAERFQSPATRGHWLPAAAPCAPPGYDSAWGRSPHGRPRWAALALESLRVGVHKLALASRVPVLWEGGRAGGGLGRLAPHAVQRGGRPRVVRRTTLGDSCRPCGVTMQDRAQSRRRASCPDPVVAYNPAASAALAAVRRRCPSRPRSLGVCLFLVHLLSSDSGSHSSAAPPPLCLPPLAPGARVMSALAGPSWD